MAYGALLSLRISSNKPVKRRGKAGHWSDVTKRARISECCAFFYASYLHLFSVERTLKSGRLFWQSTSGGAPPLLRPIKTPKRISQSLLCSPSLCRCCHLRKSMGTSCFVVDFFIIVLRRWIKNSNLTSLFTSVLRRNTDLVTLYSSWIHPVKFSLGFTNYFCHFGLLKYHSIFS